ncbi:MAG TPA: hypothetical protein VF607_08620, partial [Verrucomicrobiae bacterium]
SNFGDDSPIGKMLANWMFHFVHLVIFGISSWLLLGTNFSPENIGPTTCLSTYLIHVLVCAYCLGYFLVIFTKRVPPNRRESRPAQIFPQSLMWLAPVIILTLLSYAGVLLTLLVYNNLPQIRIENSKTVQEFIQLTTDQLRDKSGILLCDEDFNASYAPWRANLLQGGLDAAGIAKNFTVIDTRNLNWTQYHKNLHRSAPDKFPNLFENNTNKYSTALANITLLSGLCASNQVYYLNPSYGYYFEFCRQEPHGTIYKFLPYRATDSLSVPLTPELIAENEAYWDQTVARFLPIFTAIREPSTKAPAWVKRLSTRLHINQKHITSQDFAAEYLARSLTVWGVQLQAAGELAKASLRFQQAKDFNPDNLVADINLAFNKKIQENPGKPVALELENASTDRFGQYRNWNAVITACGPFDEVNFCFLAGYQYQQDGLIRQSAQQFERVHHFVPENLVAIMQLAQAYLSMRQPGPALELLAPTYTNPGKYGLSPTNATPLHVLLATAYLQKNEVKPAIQILDQEVKYHPTDENLLNSVAQVYMARNLYPNALNVINLKLAQSPTDAKWLYGKCYVSFQTGDYKACIEAMNIILRNQGDDANARFNRALAYFKDGQLDLAYGDYTQLQALNTNSFPVAYALGEIAWQKKRTAEALRNYQIYLANAPTNAPEFQSIVERVQALRAK